MLSSPIAVEELVSYRRVAAALFSEDEQAAIVDLVAYEPLAGTLIPGTGGLRKLRVGRDSSGKSGGARVIYYFYDPDHPILLLAIYAKNTKSDLSAHDKRDLTKLVSKVVARWRRK